MALVVLQGKVLPEVKEQFQSSQEEAQARTFNAWVELLLESWNNPKTKEIPTPTEEQTAELESIRQECQNKIGRLQTSHTLELEKKDEIIQQLTAQLEQLEAQPPAPAPTPEPEPAPAPKLEPGENQVLIDLPPVVAVVLDRERSTAQKKSRQEFSRADLLLNTFWDGIVKGAAYPFKVWTKSDLTKITNQLKAAQ